jgi:hypothetical protein
VSRCRTMDQSPSYRDATRLPLSSSQQQHGRAWLRRLPQLHWQAPRAGAVLLADPRSRAAAQSSHVSAL